MHSDMNSHNSFALYVDVTGNYKSKMADGRHHGKIEKSLHLGLGSSNVDEIWLGDAVRPS